MQSPIPDFSCHGAQPAPLPFNEARRLQALHAYDLLDTVEEQAYQDFTTLASAVCRAPIALISLIDSERQWFKSKVGLDVSETPRDSAFCAHAILRPGETMEVPDALQDPRFATNPLVHGDPHIRFYAGAPILTPDGLPLGTVCIIDREPRRLLSVERQALESLARQVVTQLELSRARATLERENLTDTLTGLANRRAFDRRLQEEWVRHSRNRRPLALLAFDLDRFKRINDTHGHPAGDAVLVRAAKLLGGAIRLSDMAARTGGEEFAVLLPETDLVAATTVADKLRRTLGDAQWPLVPVTASAGVAVAWPMLQGDPHVLIAQADQALYRAKGQGRDRVEAFSRWD